MPTWLAILLALAACGSKREPGEACTLRSECEHGLCVEGTCQSGETGGRCHVTSDCPVGNSCFANSCTTRRGIDATCRIQSDCQSGLNCLSGRCLDEAGAQKLANVARQAAEAAEAARRKKLADEEANMLRQSGVEANALIVEAGPAQPAGPGMRIRTATAQSKWRAFAACRSDERLVGGGCNCEQPLIGSYPSQQSATDTVGARWNCAVQASKVVTAYALCAQLP